MASRDRRVAGSTAASAYRDMPNAHTRHRITGASSSAYSLSAGGSARGLLHEGGPRMRVRACPGDAMGKKTDSSGRARGQGEKALDGEAEGEAQQAQRCPCDEACGEP